MKKKQIVWALFVIGLLAATVVAVEQPTFVGLQGRVTDSVGVPVNNGNLRTTVSTSPSCEQNLIYDYTYTGAVRAGLFSVLLGNDSNLNLTYNRDYYLCTYINGEVQRNLGGSNTTKFRGGQGIIGAGNLTNGTFTTGNYTFADNLTLGAWLLVKNDEDYLSRVLRAPIKYKDLVDRSSSENVTGAWNFTSGDTQIADTPAAQVGASEWELIYWTNFSTQYYYNITNFSNSNLHKIEFIIWCQGVDELGGTQPGGVNHALNISVNNITSSTFAYREMTESSITTIANSPGFPLLHFRPATDGCKYSTGSEQIALYGSFTFFQNDENSPIYINNNYPFLTSSNLSNSGGPATNVFLGGVTNANVGKLATLNLRMQAQTSPRENYNGTIRVYRHNFFTIY